jgi:hypothetical protein
VSRPNEQYAFFYRPTWLDRQVVAMRRARFHLWTSLPVLVLILLQVADYISTTLAISHGRGVISERNPFVSFLGLYLSKALVVCLAIFLGWRRRSNALWILCCVYLLIVANNARLLAVMTR